MANLGALAGGFLQAFSQGKIAKEQRQKDEERQKLLTQLTQLQINSAQSEAEKQKREQALMQHIADSLQPQQVTQDTPQFQSTAPAGQLGSFEQTGATPGVTRQPGIPELIASNDPKLQLALSTTQMGQNLVQSNRVQQQEFARNALAQQLRGEGKETEATAIEAGVNPSVLFQNQFRPSADVQGFMLWKDTGGIDGKGGGTFGDYLAFKSPDQIVDVAGVPHRFDRISQKLEPVSTLEDEVSAVSTIASAETSAREDAQLNARMVEDGLTAATQLPVLNRTLDLLDTAVETGGVEALKLYATDTFGVTGADTAEVSANLGKAVLSQLRTVFGAQFTEREGARLEGIEASFGRSTEANIRLLQQTRSVVRDALRRGMSAAERGGFMEIKDEMERSSQLDLTPDTPQSTSGPTPEELAVMTPEERALFE